MLESSGTPIIGAHKLETSVRGLGRAYFRESASGRTGSMGSTTAKVGKHGEKHSSLRGRTGWLGG